MKKVLIIVFAIIATSCTQTKIAYVDFSKVNEEYKAMIDLRENAKAKQIEAAGQLDALQVEFQTKVQDYYKTREAMSQKDRTIAEESLGQAQQIIQATQQQMSQSLQEENEAKSILMVDKLDSLVSNYSKTKGYNLVLGTQGSTTILYGDESLNITTEVIEMLNKEYTKE